MAKATVSFGSKVEILSTRVNRRTNELMVKIDRPWKDLSDPLIDRLFEAAQRIGDEKHPTLKEGWTPNFFYEE